VAILIGVFVIAIAFSASKYASAEGGAITTLFISALPNNGSESQDVTTTVGKLASILP
jgi:hypothetical protein